MPVLEFPPEDVEKVLLQLRVTNEPTDGTAENEIDKLLESSLESYPKFRRLDIHDAIEWGSLRQLPATVAFANVTPPSPLTAETKPHTVPGHPYYTLNSSWYVVPEPSAPPLEVDDFEILNITPSPPPPSKVLNKAVDGTHSSYCRTSTRIYR
jgi:hypothetical protein